MQSARNACRPVCSAAISVEPLPPNRSSTFSPVRKVRTGSSRQRRFGDIDGYHGIDLELSVEVKDHSVTTDNVSKELGEFLTKVSTNRILGLTIVRTIDEQATKFICETGACPLPESQMLAEVSRWEDWVSELTEHVSDVVSGKKSDAVKPKPPAKSTTALKEYPTFDKSHAQQVFCGVDESTRLAAFED